jgi:hypothetical protein
MAQPATVAVPETVAPEAGISMCTDGIMAAAATVVSEIEAVWELPL